MIQPNLTCKAASRDAVASHTLMGPGGSASAPLGRAAGASAPATGRPALRSLAAAAGLALALTLGLAAAPAPAFADEPAIVEVVPGPEAAPDVPDDPEGEGSDVADDNRDAAFGHALAALTATVVNEQSAQEMGAYTAHLEAIGVEAARAAKVDAVLAEALSHQGAPYSYGGTTPRGFDCSGFTSYVFRTALGIELPRTAAAQSGVGTSVSLDSLLPGDLLFWGRGSGVYHVAVYVGDGNYVHAAGRGKGVRVQSMEYFHPTFAKRLI